MSCVKCKKYITCKEIKTEQRSAQNQDQKVVVFSLEIALKFDKIWYEISTNELMKTYEKTSDYDQVFQCIYSSIQIRLW